MQFSAWKYLCIASTILLILTNTANNTKRSKNQNEKNKTVQGIKDERINFLAQHYGLSPREISIVKQLYEGKNNCEIASALNLAENTVKSHNYRIYKKLGAENRVQAINIIRNSGCI